ncbi:MAG: hemagglutinin, partial [Myxococcaceae bacterium]|nr:hemagglutinin [Myxococcaceae bacterium]
MRIFRSLPVAWWLLLVVSCGDSGPTPSVASDGGTPPTPCANANGCGGCASLPASAGAACDTTGATWTCSGIDSLTCAHAPTSPHDVAATSDVIAYVRVSWQPPVEGAPGGYVVRRDGFEIVRLGASARAFDDVSAEPGKIGVPVDLVATQGTRTDGVALTWSVQDQPKKSHAYEVVAVYDTLLSAPAGPALGARRASAGSYELSRDNGVTWHPAGSSTTYLDVEAALGSISAGTATTQTDYPRSLVHLEVTGMPTSIAPPPSSYRVRGVDNATPTAPSPSASGFRGVSRPFFQWQRSADDADGAFADAPGVTGSIWFDDGAPLDGAGRYYRAIMTAAGAAPATTSAARGARWGFKQIGLKRSDNACALRLDGALVCWGNLGPQPLPSGVFAQLSRANTNNYPGPDCLLSAAGDLTCFNDSGGPSLTGPLKRVATGRFDTMCGIDLTDHVQ